MSEHTLDPNQVAALRRKYTGLDNDLSYQPGHTIHNKYTTHKDADNASGLASKAYKAKATELTASKPYDPSQKRGMVNRKTYYQTGHQTLAPLAGKASQTADLWVPIHMPFLAPASLASKRCMICSFVPKCNANLRPSLRPSHAERRESFNTKYQDVLVAKGTSFVKCHEEAVTNARSSATKYAKTEQHHQKHC